MTELARLTAITKILRRRSRLARRRLRRADRRGPRADRRERRRQVDPDACARRRNAAEQRRDPDRRQHDRVSGARGQRAPMASPSSIRSWRWRRICRWRRTFFSANCRGHLLERACAGALPNSSPRSASTSIRLGASARLAVAHQQVVEIAKALSRKVKIIVFDEPTAVLVGAGRRTAARNHRSAARRRRRHRLYLAPPRRGPEHLRSRDGDEGRSGRRDHGRRRSSQSTR